MGLIRSFLEKLESKTRAFWGKWMKHWPRGLSKVHISRIREKEGLMKPIVYIAGAVALVFLVACGGGGGGAGVAKPTGSLVAVPSTCSVQSGSSDCEVTLQVSTNGVSTAMISSSEGETISAPVNQIASVPVRVSLGDATYTLNCGTECVAQATVSAKCAPGTYSTGTACASKLSYSKVVYALNYGPEFQYPIRISGTSCANMTVEMAKNETRFQLKGTSNLLPHFNTWLHTEVLPSGRIRVSAQMQADANNRHEVVLNPLTNVLSDYGGEEGPMPSTVIDHVDDGWYRSWNEIFGTNIPFHPDPNVTIYVYRGDQMIYVPYADGRILLCQELLTGEITEITRTIGGFISLYAYSN
jgi:hypothetical protein